MKLRITLFITFLALCLWQPVSAQEWRPARPLACIADCERFYQARAELKATGYYIRNQEARGEPVNLDAALRYGVEVGRGYSPERGYQDEQWMVQKVGPQ